MIAAAGASRDPCWYAVAGFVMRVIVDRLSKTYRERSGHLAASGAVVAAAAATIVDAPNGPPQAVTA
jgi:hypothetical protein